MTALVEKSELSWLYVGERSLTRYCLLMLLVNEAYGSDTARVDTLETERSSHSTEPGSYSHQERPAHELN